MSEQAVESWGILRKHGADVDSWAGLFLPIRYEAMRAECDRYALPDELFWRVALLDEVFLKEEGKKRQQEEKKKPKKK